MIASLLNVASLRFGISRPAQSATPIAPSPDLSATRQTNPHPKTNKRLPMKKPQTNTASPLTENHDTAAMGALNQLFIDKRVGSAAADLLYIREQLLKAANVTAIKTEIIRGLMARDGDQVPTSESVVIAIKEAIADANGKIAEAKENWNKHLAAAKAWSDTRHPLHAAVGERLGELESEQKRIFYRLDALKHADSAGRYESLRTAGLTDAQIWQLEPNLESAAETERKCCARLDAIRPVMEALRDFLATKNTSHLEGLGFDATLIEDYIDPDWTAHVPSVTA
jgi:hypothetical protein